MGDGKEFCGMERTDTVLALELGAEDGLGACRQTAGVTMGNVAQ